MNPERLGIILELYAAHPDGQIAPRKFKAILVRLPGLTGTRITKSHRGRDAAGKMSFPLLWPRRARQLNPPDRAILE